LEWLKRKEDFGWLNFFKTKNLKTYLGKWWKIMTTKDGVRARAVRQARAKKFSKVALKDSF